MNATTHNVVEAITSAIPCGAAILDLRSDRHISPLENVLPHGCKYMTSRVTADSLSSEYLKKHGIDCVILDIPGKLSGSLIHISRLVVELRLVVVLQFHYDSLNTFVEDAIKPFGLILRSSGQMGSQQIARIELSSPTNAMTKKRVLVISCAGWPNFGDRLGFHLIHGCLPPCVSVRHVYFPQIELNEEKFDLVVLWLGTSVFKRTLTKDILRLTDRIPHAVGIFGTQYRRSIDPAMMSQLLERLSVWFARYEEDLYLYGKNVKGVHLGDWLIHAFPMTEAPKDGLLTLGADLISQEMPLDRLIQKIQFYKRVSSARLHPLLCALTSAEQVSYREQREFSNGETSGKFRSLFLDVFGRDYPESRFFRVDRDAVIAYKARTATQIRKLRDTLSGLLGVQEHERRSNQTVKERQ